VSLNETTLIAVTLDVGTVHES